jgi:hypothetical protein
VHAYLQDTFDAASRSQEGLNPSMLLSHVSIPPVTPVLPSQLRLAREVVHVGEGTVVAIAASALRDAASAIVGRGLQNALDVIERGAPPPKRADAALVNASGDDKPDCPDCNDHHHCTEHVGWLLWPLLFPLPSPFQIS